MKKSIHLLWVLTLLLTGCNVYGPVCVDIPLIQQKGELQVEGAVYPEAPLSLRASAAYGITDHLAAAASIDPLRDHSQVMAGAYFPVGDKFVWEVYGGVGFGKGENYRDDEPGLSSNGTYTNAFVQFDGGWHNLTHFLNLDIAFSLKTGLMYNNLIIGDGTAHYTYTIDSVCYNHYYTLRHTEQECCLMVEPTVEIRFGWPDFKFNVKVGYTHFFGSQANLYYSLGIGVGMSYRFKNNK